MILEVFIEGIRLDLFEDETVTITQGVQDVKDISKIFADFSQSFNVPASKKNNAIFKNYYNADIDNGFDARTRKNSTINVNTLPFKQGKMQLNGVKIKNNIAASYSITFFGDVIKVKDLIGDDKLNTLDWLSNFDHSYTGATVLDGLQTGLDFTVGGVSYPKAVIYPLISYQKQYFYNSNAGSPDLMGEAVNISYLSGRDSGVSIDDLKPAIKLSLIVQAINEKYGFKFVGGFFDSALFKEIYVNLNKSTDKLSNGYKLVESLTTVTPVESNRRLDKVTYFATVTPKAGFENIGYKIRLSINGVVRHESTDLIFGTNTRDGVLDSPTGEAVTKFEIITNEDFDFDAGTNLTYRFFRSSPVSLGTYPNTYNDQSIALVTSILNELKDIETYKFLVSLFKTFNLIVQPFGDDIFVEDLQTWYTQGKIIDITEYIDTTEKQVDKGVIFNKIDFKFKESQQILADVFKQSNNRTYGNNELTLYTDSTETEKLDGETLDIESIFENPINERLLDLKDNENTNILYCPYINRDLKSISGEPFMFFGVSQSVASNSIGYKGSASTYEEINTNVIMPSHTRQIGVESFGLNFESEINEFTSNLNEDTIYTRNYEDYISDIFSDKRRNYNYTGILPISLLNALKLNDRLIIGNTRYIINTIKSNLTNREDELELINDIYDAPLASDISNNSIIIPSFNTYESPAVSDSAEYIGITGQFPALVDTGDGIDWIILNQFDGGTSIFTFNYSLSQNNGSAERSAQIKVTDGLNNPRLTILQVESNAGTTFNNTQQSRSFTKNNCSDGQQGSSVIYTVAAGAYQSTISQADADAQAINDINTNGQNFANANGTCVQVPISCDTDILPPSGGKGLYNLTFDAGSNLGAIKIYFNPLGFPDGIRVLYNGVYYNAVSSPSSGRIQSTSGISNAFTVLGNSNGCVPTIPDTSSYNFFDGFTGNTWNTGTPSPKSITLNTGDDQYGGNSQFNTLVIPKTSATPSNLNIEVLGICDNTGWNVDVDCPAFLPSFSSSLNQGSSVNCAVSGQTYYFAQHKQATNIKPILTNWVFSDANGLTVLSNGNYILNDSSTITVVSGVVTAVGTCTASQVFNNTQQSGLFTKNNCAAGQNGSQVTYTVAANTYQSTVSQSDANAQAIADINANGQNFANANGTCTSSQVFNNVQQSQSFTKNNCSEGQGSTVTYTVAAGAYQSTISQEDANAQATNDINTNGQANANSNGTCTSNSTEKLISQSYSTSADACNSGDLVTQVFFLNDVPVSGETVWLDSFQTTIFVGNSGFYRVDNVPTTKSITINSNGIIGTVNDCFGDLEPDPSPTVYGFLMSTNSASNNTDACNLQGFTGRFKTGANGSVPENGQVVYLDSNAATEFNGNNLWFKSEIYVFRISTVGVIFEIGFCGGLE